MHHVAPRVGGLKRHLEAESLAVTPYYIIYIFVKAEHLQTLFGRGESTAFYLHESSPYQYARSTWHLLYCFLHKPAEYGTLTRTTPRLYTDVFYTCIAVGRYSCHLHSVEEDLFNWFNQRFHRRGHRLYLRTRYR